MVQRISRLVLLALGLLGGCTGAATTPGVPEVLAPSEWRPVAPARAPSSALAIFTEPGEVPHLELAGDPAKRLSLEHTHVSAKLTGFVAEVEVSQTYVNPFSEPIEAVYVFPLPENSAVNHMRIAVAERVIEAQIREREQARHLYDRAKRSGHTAALLEQERPNVFTQAVANIEPGKKIDVVVRYLQDLSYDAGAYEFVFPMVVGPRFMPGAELAGPPSGTGTRSDTDRVPDASRISPPYAGKGDRSGRDISLELVADATVAVTDFQVPTHQVVSRRPADGTLRLTLAEKDAIPNRDFVLRYRVARAEPKATLYLGSDDAAARSGFFSLIVAPPELDVDELVGRREIVFVVDVSGSMSGAPLAMCKTAMREALGRLRPVDTFNILTFSGATRRAFAAPRPANRGNVQTALAVVDGLHAGGGTHMADAVAAALGPEVEADRHRYVFFMTDGYVGNDDEIISASRRFVEAVEGEGRRARVFGFGVGSSVNRHLIDGLSKAGNGLPVYATTREDPLLAVNRFFHYIDRAVLENLRISWGGLEAEELYPNPLPDLFASRPLIVHGRYRGRPDAPVTVHAKAQGKSFDLQVEIQRASAALSGPRVLGALWAREKVGFLEQELGLGKQAAVAQITKLGLDFHLVTRFTSLIAVDDARVVGDGTPRTIIEALDAPEGVDIDMAGGLKESLRPRSARDQREESATLDQDEAAPAAAPGMAPVSVEAHSAPRRGCGCRFAGDAPETPQSLWLATLAAGAGALGRRRRKSRHEGTLG